MVNHILSLGVLFSISYVELTLGNKNQREIHPAEAIWWQTTPGSNADVHLILLQDAAIGRFTEIEHFDFDEDHDGEVDFPHAGWAPWVTYPQAEEVKIPFQFDSATGRFPVINIEVPRSLHVVTPLDPELADSDDGATHKLKLTFGLNETDFNRPTLVEVREKSDSNLGVQFTDVCRSSGGNIRGMVRVLGAIGHKNTRDAGYLVIRFKMSSDVNREPVVETLKRR